MSPLIPETVHLLEFSRTPRSFYRALNECPELQGGGHDLREKGLDAILPSGIKMGFLRVAQHEGDFCSLPFVEEETSRLSYWQ